MSKVHAKRPSTVLPWLLRIGQTQFLRIPLFGWVAIGLLCIFFMTWLVWLPGYGLENPSTEDVIVELSRKVVHDYTSRGGVRYTYRVYWNEGATEVGCRVPEHALALWAQLEAGKDYKLKVTRTRAYCFVNEAHEVPAAK